MTRASREVLKKSVIQAIPTYNMSCFKLPKTWYDKLNALIARYWWKKGEGVRRGRSIGRIGPNFVIQKKKKGALVLGIFTILIWLF